MPCAGETLVARYTTITDERQRNGEYPKTLTQRTDIVSSAVGWYVMMHASNSGNQCWPTLGRIGELKSRTSDASPEKQ